MSTGLNQVVIVHGSLESEVPDLSSNTILVIMDVFDEEIYKHLTSKGTPGLVVSDRITKLNFPITADFVGLPLFFESLVNSWDLEEFSRDMPLTYYNFNFLCNKKRINRHLLVKFVEWFEFKHFDYTWSGLGEYFDATPIIDEIERFRLPWVTAEIKSHLLAPVALKSRWLGPVKKNLKNGGANLIHGRQRTVWTRGVGSLISNSAISLITESNGLEKTSVFTEKILFATLGLTFPIWIGGYGQADAFSEMGFDSFNDIINHDYQYCDSLLERCYRAFDDNFEILSNLEAAKEARNNNFDRLIKNRELFFSDRLRNYTDEKISRFDRSVQKIMTNKIIKPFLSFKN